MYRTVDPNGLDLFVRPNSGLTRRPKLLSIINHIYICKPKRFSESLELVLVFVNLLGQAADLPAPVWQNY